MEVQVLIFWKLKVTRRKEEIEVKENKFFFFLFKEQFGEEQVQEN